ncbi:MAG: DEAD/DEAH box helicase [Ancrocorticia sp.]
MDEKRGLMAEFSVPVRNWFAGAFGKPTRVQREAWRTISGGSNALVIAPTGSGKTLAAFLWAIDRLAVRGVSGGDGVRGGAGHTEGVNEQNDEGATRSSSVAASSWSAQDSRIPSSGTKPRGKSRGKVRVLYVSPLKALGVDVHKNLQVPLAGIQAECADIGLPVPAISTGVRSGDSTASERRRLVSHPPDILITTPESLYLMLTSAAAEILSEVESVIVDEVHALAGNKRGAHLAVSLERLDEILPVPAQRIGLSATVRPAEEVARFLGGSHPVSIIEPPASKVLETFVEVPFADLANPMAENLALGLGRDPTNMQPGADGNKRIDAEHTDASDGSENIPNDHRINSTWPAIERAVYERVIAARSTIVFANSRRVAERMTAALNDLHAERHGEMAGTLPDFSDAILGRAGIIGGTSNLGGQAGTNSASSNRSRNEEIARSHHGSVSKEQRLDVETRLKEGSLRCVVATGTLELGIDMGAVDQIIQLDAPPSVASGLQRIGRAGHQVGEVSTAYFYPTHRASLVETAAIVEQIRERNIEAVSVITNPLDILAQQTIAAVSRRTLAIDEWFETLRRSAPFHQLKRRTYESVLDMLSGKYPSSDFSELRPRIVWNRTRGTLEARPGARQLAILGGGTIPDRGLYRVEIAAGDDPVQESSGSAPARFTSAGSQGTSSAQAGSTHTRSASASGSARPLPVPGARSAPLPRIGELDEEMVYESRVGEIFVLGTTSWRIREITADRVRVVPAPGRRGKVPFWHGERASRPAHLGTAIGRFSRELDRAVQLRDTTEFTTRLAAAGLDARAISNLYNYAALQHEAVGTVPSDVEFVVERTKDEVGDWQILMESPLGMAVHEPWALAVGARLRERHGGNFQISAANDGMIIRFPDVEGEPPGAELFRFEPAELVEIVQREVTGSALFAARFRECAARALLLGGNRPGKRAPLWQQRHRSARLLEVAAAFEDFPIVVEASRECLHDVYDLPALIEVCRGLESGRIRLRQITTERPSPYAHSMLFQFVGEFLYQGDVPAGERKLAALSLDLDLMEQLLGPSALRDVLNPAAIAAIESELQHTAPGWRKRGAEGIVDLLRELGPLTMEEIAARVDDGTESGSGTYGETRNDGVGSGDDGVAGREAEGSRESEPIAPIIGELLESGRIFLFSTEDVPDSGFSYVAQVEDAGTIAALGHAVPGDVVVDYPARVWPLHDLVTRYLRTHTVVTVPVLATRFGAAEVEVERVLRDLESEGRAKEGAFVSEETSWMDAGVLDRIRRRSLMLARHAIQPVDQAQYVRFLLRWQYCGRELTDGEGLLEVVEQLCGFPFVASTLETMILPQRVTNYTPALLDGLLGSGEVCWVGEGRTGGEGRVSLHLRDGLALTVNPAYLRDDKSSGEHGGYDKERWIAERLAGGGAIFGSELLAAAQQEFPELTAADFADHLWELAWGGIVTSDSLAALRAAVSGRSVAQKTQRVRPRSQRTRRSSFASMRQAALLNQDPRLAGRWSLVPRSADESDGGAGTLFAEGQTTGEDRREKPTEAERASTSLGLLLDRYGVVSRGSVMAEGYPGGFAAVYDGLAQLESAGYCRRGHFVEGINGAQFATAEAVNVLRDEGEGEAVVVLSAVDPANPFGAAIPWPDSLDPGAAKPRRNAGALIAIYQGKPAFYLERGGRTALTFGLAEEADPDVPDGRELSDKRDAQEANDPDETRRQIAAALVDTCRRGRIDDFVLDTVDGERSTRSPWASALKEAGFSVTPRGLSYTRPAW